MGSLDGDVVPAPQLDSIKQGYSGLFPIRRFRGNSGLIMREHVSIMTRQKSVFWEAKEEFTALSPHLNAPPITILECSEAGELAEFC